MFCDDFDFPDDVCVEFLQVFGRNPVLECCCRADFLDWVVGEEGGYDGETEDIADEAGCLIASVPLLSNESGVFLVEDWIEDGLMGQPGREGTKAGFRYQIQLFLANGAVESGEVFAAHSGRIAHPEQG